MGNEICQDRVTELLKQTGRHADADGLRSVAELLRHIRNYGVHPRGHEADSIEHHFTDAGQGRLLSTTYSYLKRLADLVEARLQTEPPRNGEPPSER